MTISIWFLVKVLVLLCVIILGGTIILFPIDDLPTSTWQWIVYVIVVALAVDFLFLHYINVSVDISLTP